MFVGLATFGPFKNARGIGPCDYCGSKFQCKKKCYYFYPQMQPEVWKPMQGKEFFMTN